MDVRTSRLIAEAMPCDMTLPWSGEPGDQSLREAMPGRYRAAGWAFVSLTITTDDEDMTATIRTIAAERRAIEARDDCILIETVDDILRARQQGRIALGLHFQGSRPVERDLALVGLYYKLGIRHMLMAYNQKNFVADGCHELGDGALSRFGHALVAEMNRVGMIVDVAHTGYRSSMDAIAASSAPVIVSHGNLKTFNDHPRCYTDEQIRAIAATGGVFGLTGLGIFLGGNDSSTQAFVRQIDHVVQLVGAGHVGFGLDYVFDMPALEQLVQRSADKWPESCYTTRGIQQIGPERLPEIVDALLALGYKDEDVLAVLGSNWLRVCAEVWR
ncbi:dipeptidase [Sphingosinicella rhizophila]|uniref:Membrane dipeptidase n=1 Tax=Sphingosinicella rhizophila TaxID=3050082 RepID=A0ABU3QB81_9SPHN|nr:membrane dipeptidase [Sphingosinicella sp. GR2756]MDT9600597.1 membrane dipeptidase [Sphingosinicella sp. GR2756]